MRRGRVEAMEVVETAKEGGREDWNWSRVLRTQLRKRCLSMPYLTVVAEAVEAIAETRPATVA